MAEWGIWTANDGGFVETQLYSESAADHALQRWVDEAAEDDKADVLDDLSVVRICDDHEEQPLESCDECATEGEEDEDA